MKWRATSGTLLRQKQKTENVGRHLAARVGILHAASLPIGGVVVIDRRSIMTHCVINGSQWQVDRAAKAALRPRMPSFRRVDLGITRRVITVTTS
jgi:hypothetical protein